LGRRRKTIPHRIHRLLTVLFDAKPAEYRIGVERHFAQVNRLEI
jgi:hypothetical protein